MTVADFLLFTKRHWLLLLVTTLIGVLAGGAYWLLAPKTYESTASGFVMVEGSNAFGAGAAASRARSYLPLITSTPVRERIAEAAGVPASSLDGRLNASIPEEATLITVTATASDPDAALTLANGALSALGEVIAEIEERVATEEGAGLVVLPIENAVAPTSPVSPDRNLSIGIGALAGLVLGYLIAAVRMITDVRVRTGTELAALTGSGLLGRIPKIKGHKGAAGLTDRAGESLRQIRTGLRFASVDTKVRSIVITSAHQGEGKTTIAVALARVLAQSGQHTIVIDADLRRPRLADEMGIDGTVGLSQVLSGQALLLDALRRTDDPRLVVLPAGGIPPNPSEMLGSEAMKRLLEELPRDCMIVIDAPPVLPVTDALLVGSAADGVVVVASAGKTHKTDVRAARGLLEQANVRVLGSILNRVPAREAADGYSYRRQYKSYYTEVTPDRPSAPVRPRASAASDSTADAEDAMTSLLSDASTPTAPTAERVGHRRTP